MLVNEKKTTLMYFSGENSYDTIARLTLKVAEIEGQQMIKLLGVTIGKKCTVRQV